IAARKQQEPRLNASDATPDAATEERPSSDRPAPSESSGPAPENTERSSEAVASEHAPAGAPATEDGALRPRRRRRRRRRPPHLAGASSERQPPEGSVETATEGAPAEAGTPQAETAAEGAPPERRTLRLRNWRRRHRPMRTAPRLGEAGDNPPNAENGAAEAIANAATAAAPGDI